MDILRTEGLTRQYGTGQTMVTALDHVDLQVERGQFVAIIDNLWQSEEFIDENTLNVNIVRLRKTLAEIGLPDYLETKRGLGYLV